MTTQERIIENTDTNVTVSASQATKSEGASLLRDSVEQAMNNYFSSLEGQPVTGIYQMVISEVEAPLLESVMKYTKGNQSKAAIVLGINRGTLRNKLKTYGID